MRRNPQAGGPSDRDRTQQNLERHGTDRAVRQRQMVAIACLTLAAGALRIWGVRWGLPDAHHMSSYHPDEGVNLINGVLDRGVLRPHLDIGFYNYGSFYFLLWQVAGAVNSAYSLIALGPASGPNVPLPESIASLILVGRVLSVLAGTATVWVLCLLVREMWGFRSSLVAGALQAAAPLATIHSRFATVDATATLLVTLALLAAVRLMRVGTMRLAIGAGALAGLAGATRYNAVLVLLAALSAALQVRGSDESTGAWPARLRLTGGVLAGCIIGFLMGCPGAVLNWSKFSTDLMFEAQKSAQGMGLLFEQTGNGWVYHWIVSLRFALGWPLLFLATAGGLAALKRRTPADLVLLAFAVPYYGMMGAAQVRFTRYMLPLIPVLAAWVAALGSDPSRWMRRRTVRTLGGVLCAAGFLGEMVLSLAFSIGMIGSDARDAARTYLERSLRPGGTVAFATTPWYWSPPLLPEFTAPVPGSVRRRMILEAQSRFDLRLPGPDREWDVSVFHEPKPDAVVVSDLESQDAFRVRHPDAIRFQRELERWYAPVVFGGRPRLFGWPVITARYVPVDLLYVTPTVRVYERRDARAKQTGDQGP
jgi:hypothetical protein